MPDLGSSTFSQTDANNNSGTMPSWSGSAAPSTLDDAGRALQGAVTREWNWRNFTVTATGTSDAKTLTFSVAPAAYYNGQRFAFIANTTNTTSATLNVNSLGAKTIKKDVSGTLTNLSASDMVSGVFVEVAYNTANDCFVWVNRGIDAFPAGTAALPSITTTGDANTGFWFPAADTIAASTAGSERVRIDSSGNVGIGGASTGSKLHINEGDIYTGKASGVTQLTASSGAVNAFMHANSGGVAVAGTSSNHQFWLMTNNTQRAILGTDGTFVLTSSGGLGYGTGAGGTVTQVTNKSTAVTLNKTTGQITMASNNLASAATAVFNVFSDKVTSKDTVVIAHSADGGTPGAYTVVANTVGAGFFNVRVTNVSGGTLGEAVVLNFAVIKGANA